MNIKNSNNLFFNLIHILDMNNPVRIKPGRTNICHKNNDNHVYVFCAKRE